MQRIAVIALPIVALSELALVFGCRSAIDPAWRAPRNLYLVGGVLVSAGILAAAIYFPALQHAAGTVSLGSADLGIVTALSVAPLVAIESAKALRRSLRSSP